MKEQISALMDDELDTDSVDHLFKAVKSDKELGACWAHYHLIGDAMRGSMMIEASFTQRLMQKLEAEPAVLAPRSTKTERKPVVWSLAASVAAVLLVGWVVLQQQLPAAGDAPVVEIAQNIPSEYLYAHQAVAPSSSSYFIQQAAYSGNSQ